MNHCLCDDFGKKVIPISSRSQNDNVLCIKCAVTNGDFKQRAPVDAIDPLGGAMPKAWIKGRSFELVAHPALKQTCSDCGTPVSAAYCPDDQLIA